MLTGMGNRGRPPKLSQGAVVSFWLPAAVVSALSAEAKAEGVNRSEALRRRLAPQTSLLENVENQVPDLAPEAGNARRGPGASGRHPVHRHSRHSDPTKEMDRAVVQLENAVGVFGFIAIARTDPARGHVWAGEIKAAMAKLGKLAKLLAARSAVAG